MFGNSLKRSFLCLTAEPGTVCAGLPKKPRPAPPSTQSPPPKSLLLSLPAELRNEIYSHALIQQSPIILPYAYETRSRSRGSGSEPSLLSASRTIRLEATPIYYGCNIFEAPSHASAYRFLKQLGYAKIKGLRMFRPVDLVVPQSAHRRWFESVRRGVNKLVKEVGKGALAVEAVSLPVRVGGKGGEVSWVGLREAGFVIDEEGGGYWSIGGESAFEEEPVQR